MIYRLLCLLPTLSEPTGSHTKNKLKRAQKNPSDLYDELHRDVTEDIVILCDKM